MENNAIHHYAGALILKNIADSNTLLIKLYQIIKYDNYLIKVNELNNTKDLCLELIDTDYEIYLETKKEIKNFDRIKNYINTLKEIRKKCTYYIDDIKETLDYLSNDDKLNNLELDFKVLSTNYKTVIINLDSLIMYLLQSSKNN